MQELSRYVFLAGGLLFLLLGTAYIVVTPQQPGERKGLSPARPGLEESMAGSDPVSIVQPPKSKADKGEARKSADRYD